ncbi:hypothetical protein [Rhodococcus sp. YH3-3]|uniref:hypothetical protein n=1 Tax=Rhodococcus sp. YH3-3 TaxID=1803579 RepID=UPI0007DB173B|nr:hypothetical protein [Rhodococcus sp. YH3-3]
MKRTSAALLVAGLSIAILAGCSGEPQSEIASTTQTVAQSTITSTTTTPSAPTTTPYVVPEYWMRVNGPRYITVVVPTRYPAAQMTRVMQDVVDMHSGKEGGWHVDIVCGTSAEDASGATLGTSSFALDNLGLAQTGLKSKFQAATIIREGATCD